MITFIFHINGFPQSTKFQILLGTNQFPKHTRPDRDTLIHMLHIV